MAIGEVIVSTMGGLTGIVLTWWLTNQGKNKGIAKEDVLKHSIFATLESWRVEQMQSLTTKDKVKDEVIRLYAKTVLETYLTSIKALVSTLSKDNVVIMTDFYLNLIQQTHDTLYQKGIPAVYIQKVYEYTSVVRERIFIEVEEIEQADKPYFDKVYAVLNQLRFLACTLVKSLPQITINMNGEFDEALKEWQRK